MTAIPFIGGERAVTNIRPRTNDKKKPIALMTAAVLLAFVLIPFGSLSPIVTADETAPAPSRSGRIVQYVQDASSFPLTDAQAQQIDQINYAFALIADGQADVSHMRVLDEVQRYLMRHPHITGVLSIGGWGADGFSQACQTPAGRQLLTNSLLSLMDAYGFTGVDIDWEYPGMSSGGTASSESDVENWYALLSLLRAGLDEREASTGREYVLSVALSAGEEQIAAIDGERLNSLVDQAVVMAYDLRGFDRMTGHHAGLYPDGETMLSGAWAVLAWMNSGLSADRILLGIPQYGRMWRNVSSTGDGLHARAETSGNKIIPLNDIPGMIESGGYARHYDGNAQAPYLFNGTNFVSYDDAESAAAKAAYAQEHGLLGTALWAAGHDVNGMLLDALDAAFAPQSDENPSN